jgi:hypothetical protein
MVTRNSAVFCIGLISASVVAFGQTPIALDSPSITSSTPAPTATSSACGKGYAEIVAKHFHVTQDPHSALLTKGTLKVTARRGWVEETESKAISYKGTEGTFIPELIVPIRDGALERPACVPFSSIYGVRAMRYQMSVTDDGPTPAVLLVVTTDLNDPQYFLDDDSLYRVEQGDGDVLAANAKGVPPAPIECRESKYVVIPKSCDPK